MSAESIALALGLRRSGRDYVGQCPACGYRSGFSVTEKDGRVLAYCAVGGCTWETISAALVKPGRLPRRDDEPRKVKPPGWRALWDRAQRLEIPGSGWTLPVDYLRARDITISVPSDVLRFRMNCKHRSGASAPAMIAFVEHVRHGPVAVHRIWLLPDGSGKADLYPNKMSLGPIKGGAIRLAPVGPNGELGVAEGIEDALSYMQIKGIPTWSAVAAGGIEQLVLPDEARVIYIALDKDPVGLKAAQNAARRWLGEGRRVFFAQPPHGKDWNDTLRVLARGGPAA
jgi:putative DNA primase/helicase